MEFSDDDATITVQSSLKLKEQHLSVSEWNRILDGISQSAGAVGVNKCTPMKRKRWRHEMKRRAKKSGLR